MLGGDYLGAEGHADLGQGLSLDLSLHLRDLILDCIEIADAHLRRRLSIGADLSYLLFV